MLLINYQCCALGTDWIQWEPRPIHSTATNTTRSCPFHNPPFQLVLLYCPTTSLVLQYPWCCSVSASGTRIHKALYVKVTHKEASFVNQQMDLRSPQLCTEKLSEMNPNQPVYWGVSIHTKPSKITKCNISPLLSSWVQYILAYLNFTYPTPHIPEHCLKRETMSRSIVRMSINNFIVTACVHLPIFCQSRFWSTLLFH